VATILYRYLGYIGIVILACFVLSLFAYHKGYQTANFQCEKEKIELIQQKESEKTDIIAKTRKKSSVERRKALGKYVIK